jgi:hypothetical protein
MTAATIFGLCGAALVGIGFYGLIIDTPGRYAR